MIPSVHHGWHTCTSNRVQLTQQPDFRSHTLISTWCRSSSSSISRSLLRSCALVSSSSFLLISQKALILSCTHMHAVLGDSWLKPERWPEQQLANIELQWETTFKLHSSAEQLMLCKWNGSERHACLVQCCMLPTCKLVCESRTSNCDATK